MIARTYFIGLTSLILVAGCRPSRTYRDNASPAPFWQRRPLVIDGSDADWNKPLSYYDKKEGLHYALSNDKNNIYIMLSAKDQQEQQKIIEGGLTVWVNSQAAKENSDAFGIAYPTGRKPSRESAIMNQARPDLFPEKKNSVEEDLAAYTLYGFKKDETVQNFGIDQDNEEGLQVKIGFNTAGELIYEAMIPLNSIYPQNSSTNFTGKSLAVGFFIEGLPPDANRRRSGGGSGVSVGGGFGMGSFGSGAGIGLSLGSGAFGGRGSRGAERQLYEQTRIWQVITLSRPGPAH